MTAAAMLPGLSQGCMSAAAMQYERAERGSQADLEVVGEAADGRAMVRLAREQPADVMVMDVRMPELDGVAATREICQTAERPRVLILTTFDLDEYAFAALRAGASGFPAQIGAPEELLYAIRCVHQGDAVMAPSTTRRSACATGSRPSCTPTRTASSPATHCPDDRRFLAGNEFCAFTG